MKYEWNNESYHNQTLAGIIHGHDIKTSLSSLKQRLHNPDLDVRAVDIIADVARGLALIMDKIEEIESEMPKMRK